MNKKRSWFVGIGGFVLLASLVVGASAVFAQGGPADTGHKGQSDVADTSPYGQASPAAVAPGVALPPAVPGDVPDDVVAAMTAGILDEYHAYAVYQAVIDQFGAVAPFVNIQAAEAQHIAAWETLFNRYDIAIPAVPVLDPVPQFDSLAAACQIAADAEIANFDLYDAALDIFQDYPDILQVVTSLRNASEFNHLPAFQSCAG